jgi:hypothetical protein
MTAQVQKLFPDNRLVCSGCGKSTEAACACGVAYVPAGQRAADAVAASPEKSDRAIAADLGVGNATVSRVRRATVSHDTVVEPRTGRDGKTRRMPQKKAAPKYDSNYLTAACLRIDQAHEMGLNIKSLLPELRPKDCLDLAHRAQLVIRTWTKAIALLEDAGP